MKGWYRKILGRLHNWLDKEISYLDSSKYYTEQDPLTREDIKDFSAPLKRELNRLSTSNFNFSLRKQVSPRDFSDELTAEIKLLTEGLDPHTCGVIIEASRVRNLGAIVAAMTHRQLKEPKTRFFIATDSDEIILKLVNIFNWAHRHFYTLPTLMNLNLNSHERNSVTYEILSKLDNFIVVENSTLLKRLNDKAQKFPSLIDAEEVFVFQPTEMHFV